VREPSPQNWDKPGVVISGTSQELPSRTPRLKTGAISLAGNLNQQRAEFFAPPG
jgi:hypothetical protein